MPDDCWNRIGAGGDRSCPELSTHIHCRNCPTFEAGGRRLLEREPPPEYLAEWARLLASGAEADESLREAIVVFRVGSDWLGLPATLFVEIAPSRPVRRIPRRTGRTLLGLVNIRGEIHLCVSLAHLLGLGEPDGTAARLAVVRWKRHLWVFPVDEVQGVQPYREREEHPVPATVAVAGRGFIRKVLHLAERRVGLLDAEALFPALERETA